MRRTCEHGNVIIMLVLRQKSIRFSLTRQHAHNMVKSPDFVDCYNHAIRHNPALGWTLFVEREMWAHPMIVAESA